jgi:hypothetical protein
MDPNKHFSIGQRILIGPCLFIVRHIGMKDNIMILEEISEEPNPQGDQNYGREDGRNRD